MVRFWSVVLGLGLGLLWLTELGSPAYTGFTVNPSAVNAIRWITWLDLAAAVGAFAIVATVPWQRTRQGAPAGWPVALAFGLFALWIVGLSANVAPWVTWWNFAFACAFLLVGFGGYSEDSARRYEGGYPDYRSYGEWGRFYGPADLRARSTRGYRRSDLRISEDVNDRLSLASEIDPTDIEVKVSEGVVTLTGSVGSRRERWIAEAIADSVPGVRDVHNELSTRAVAARGRSDSSRAA